MSIQFRYSGDGDKARSLVPFAVRNFLEGFKKRLAFNDKKQGCETYKDSLGNVIRITCQNIISENYQIDIFSPVSISISSGETFIDATILFLIKSDTIFATWKVEGFNITPISFTNIKDYCTYIPIPTPYVNNYGVDCKFTFPSTTQSNIDLNEHKYTVEDIRKNYSFYGIIDPNYNTLDGLRNAYEPIAFDSEDRAFNDDYSYMTDYSIKASSRKPWMVWSGSVIKNLVLRNTAGVVKYEWDDSGGAQVGDTITGIDYYYAVSPSEAVYTIDSGDSVTPIVSLNWIDCSSPLFTWRLPTVTVYTPYYYYSYKTKKLNFSGTNISNICVPTAAGGYLDTAWGGAPYEVGYRTYRQYGGEFTIQYSATYGQSIGMLDLITKENSLDNFIGFFTIYGNTTYYTGTYDFSDGGVAVPYRGVKKDGNGGGGESVSYFLVYKVNGIDYLSPPIAILSRGNSVAYIAGVPQAPVAGMKGTRIVALSIYENNGYFYYTYILQTYSGSTAVNALWDSDDTRFTFTKRIIGIIDIDNYVSDAVSRIEYEVTDEFMGSNTATFDKTVSAALGIHIVRNQEE